MPSTNNQKRVLILGAGGMLGHQLCRRFRNQYDTWATVRKAPSAYAKYDLLAQDRLIGGVDAFNLQTVTAAIAEVQPDVIINCIGIIKQLKTAKDPIISLTINALFPHQLATIARASRARLIHISTDCVFSGTRGMYSEDDVADATDLYGRTKYLGEVSNEGALTIRSSIIGPELNTQSGLVEWFLSNVGDTVRGFHKAIYSGFTTQTMANIIADIIDNHADLSGLYQVSSEPINKHDLLTLVRDKMDVDIKIVPDDSVVIDRSLDSTRFRQATGFTPPTWDEMIAEMVADWKR